MIVRLLRKLKSGIAITVVVSLAFGLVVWFLGPIIGIAGAYPLAGVMARIIALGVIALGALFAILMILLRRARKEKSMAEDIVESVDDDTGENDNELVKAELGELKDKLKEALGALRKSKMGGKSLYELPWYVMIGPPGAGKTTAIVNSGLQFPLADKMGKGAIGGVGGTRNCDWWFTNNAVLIDTAGRYTTQDSFASEANAGWLGFLNLLKRHRKRQPINGALVAISLSDLSMQDAATQQSHAAAIRLRLDELRQKLGVRFPVYVLFTKSDMIAGFSEFFDNLGKEDLQQVWGFTLPLPKKKSKKGEPERSQMAAFDEEFGQLLGQINAQSLERMQQETDPQRRALISSFAPQVASVRATARGFLQDVFQDNAFESQQLLRGVYFTSGTQEGTPIDRLMMGMARTFGIGRQAIGTGRGTGRSYFLTKLFEDVIFPEAGLVSADDKLERRYRWTKRIAIAAAIVGGIGLTSMWVRSYLGNSAMVANAAEQVETYRLAAAQIPGSPIEDRDLPAVVPALNVLRDMPGNPTVNDPEVDGAMTWGLYQGKVLGNEAAQAYRAALNAHLLPRLLLRLEEQMQASMNNPDFLYESLKIYLMLGQQGPMNTELVKEWMAADWFVAFQGSGREDLRNDLYSHLSALLLAPMDQIGLNGPLVEQIQSLLSEMPLAQRIYNGIINSPKAKDLRDWRLTDVGGPAIARAIVRSSGKPLSEGVEGIFTYDGFNTVFLAEALGVTERIQRESWVLGPAGAAQQNEQALRALSRDVLDLYYNDYISAYDKILGDIDIIPMESLSHAVEVTQVLSGPTSPIVNLLQAIASETRLTEDRSALSANGLAEGAATVGALEARSVLDSRTQLFIGLASEAVGGDNNAPPPPPGSDVEDRFAWLHELVEEIDGQPSQLDELMRSLDEVRQELNRMSNAERFGGASGDTSAIVRFQDLASRQSGPVPRWASQIASGSSGITADGTRASINARWEASVLQFCEQALGNRYPFDRRAQADVALGDFARLFAPNGMIDSFFNENLRDFVDTRARPWAWKRVNDTDLGISQAVLQQMQYAAEIRDAFFAGGETPSVKFQITPQALDEKAKLVVLNIDGQEVTFQQRMQPTPSAVDWPGGIGLARISFQPTRSNAENTLSRDGPWAWFRLLSAAELRRTNVSDRTRIIFNVGGRIAIFEVQSGSVLNPFALPALSNFSCPKSF